MSFSLVLKTLRNSAKPNKNLCNVLSACNQHFFYSLKTEIGDQTDPKKKKKTTPIPKITLISPNEEISVVTLEEAQKLSRRRELKLVKIVDLDAKTQRPVFKLMTGAEYHAEDLKQREQKKLEKASGSTLKGDKLLVLSSKISMHDLESRIKNISKWLIKRFEVRVVINAEGNMEGAEKVYKTIEDSLKKEDRILQKRIKNDSIKFQILPPKQTSDESKSDNSQEGGGGL